MVISEKKYLVQQLREYPREIVNIGVVNDQGDYYTDLGLLREGFRSHIFSYHYWSEENYQFYLKFIQKWESCFTRGVDSY